jgi:hypothetical protein
MGQVLSAAKHEPTTNWPGPMVERPDGQLESVGTVPPEVGSLLGVAAGSSWGPGNRWLRR